MDATPRLLPLIGLAAAWLVTTGTVCAQTRFAEFHRDHLPVDDGNTFETVLADVDGDGDADLVIGKDRADVLMLNDGLGAFTDVSSRLPGARRDTTGLEAVDVDGDGDLDLVIGRAFTTPAQNELWLNDGTGRFANATSGRLPVRLDVTSHVESGDVDGDGDADLVFGNSSQNTLYLNDGGGFFVDATATHMPNDPGTGFGVFLVDVDADLDLDLVTAGLFGANKLYANDGAGVFTDVSATQMPGDVGYNNQVRAGDVDGDGDPDLVLSAYFRRQTRLYLNDGAGAFTDATATNMPVDDHASVDLDLGDVDGDGDLDLVIGNGDTTAQDRLYLNDGLGVFSDATATHMPLDDIWANAIRLGDVDGDGDLDLVAGHPVPDRTNLYLNDGSGRFHDATERGLPRDDDDSNAIAAGDVDADGDLDLVVGNSGQNRLLLGDATGRFVDVTPRLWPADQADTRDVVLTDLDADGDLDALLGNGPFVPTQQYRNDGLGAFVDVTAATMPPEFHPVRELAFGDVDGDGDSDLVLAADNDSRLFLNDGRGAFVDGTAGRIPTGLRDVEAGALGDVDGDGDLDIVFGSDFGQDVLLVNDGSGRFVDESATRMPTDAERTFALAFADVDGDADLDLVLGAFSGVNRLYENDGSGVFTDVSAARIPAGPRGVVQDIAAADVDLDGDVDLLFAQRSGQNLCYENDGTGRFVDATSSLPLHRGDTYGLALEDIDSDGDPDVVVANHDLFGNKILLNRRRHMRAPLLPRRGVPFRLELELGPTGDPLMMVAVGMMGVGTTAIPVPPFGVWRIDPGGSGMLPPVYIPPRARSVAVPIAVPSSPSLRGVRVHFQFTLVHPSRIGYLGTLVSETVL